MSIWPFLITFLMFFIVPMLAKKGFVLYSAIITLGYTIYTASIYYTFHLVAMNLLMTVLFWITVFAGYSQRHWVRKIRPTENIYQTMHK